MMTSRFWMSQFSPRRNPRSCSVIVHHSGIIHHSTIGESSDGNVWKNLAIGDESTVLTYSSYSGKNWIGYDNVESVVNKVKYAKDQGLGGYFF